MYNGVFILQQWVTLYLIVWLENAIMNNDINIVLPGIFLDPSELLTDDPLIVS